MIKIVKNTLFLLVALVLLSSASPVQAQPLSISISPPLHDVVSLPGKSFRLTFTVSNVGDPIIIKPFVRRFEPSDELGAIKLDDTLTGPIQFELANNNIDLGKPFLLEDNVGQEIILNVRIPDNTDIGDYYYTFFVENEVPKRLEGRTSQVNIARIGTNILISVVDGQASEIEGGIGSLDVEPEYTLTLGGRSIAIVDSLKSIPVSLIVQNTGNHRIRAQGTLSVTNILGGKKAYPLQQQYVLAQSSRAISTDSIPHNTQFTSASHVIQGFAFGPYTVSAQVNFGEGTTSEAQSVTFIAVPLTALFVVGLIGIAFIAARIITTFTSGTKQNQKGKKDR